ncbi:MAG: transglutaminase domain-containing protein [Chitinophagaceae bacterium]|nr:transglutaminase domain-containing protein [Chitinophagaceae bacterium]
MLSAIVLMMSIMLIASQKIDTFSQLVFILLPVVLYSLYLIFAAEQIYNYKDKSQRFWWFMTRRIVVFLLLVSGLSLLVAKNMKSNFEEAIAQAGGAGKEGENGMLKKDKNGDFDLKDYSQLRSNQGRSNELLFAAHIDNFFPNSDIPNPLYLTAFYYTKFDTSTETFERDIKIPKNDLFEPNVAKIALFNTQIDSSVMRNGMGDKARRVVDIEIYSKKLSPETYLAPNIGFFVQPIAVEKDFRSEFRSAFRAKGYVSELNSAYFIYNAKDPQIKLFQEQRFDVLRKAGGYDKVDKKFMAYYTQMPTDAKFRRIGVLANQIAANAKTPVDKVIALRDYFLSKDDDGKPLFSYTDNPGVPDIPSASKLMYFLFDNHKGYCAYYAGATLFMLRSLGIPSRITVGFMTVDRSDKNKGWYWYYADQAHAWVQVYFPGYGWMDFDTTVGNDDAQESPKPDGTPPMQPPHAWFVSEGEIVSIDTLKKTLKLKTSKILYHDKEHLASGGATSLLLDVRIANIQKDSAEIAITDLKIGDSATAVSYAESIKKLQNSNANQDAQMVLKMMPSVLPIDDVYVKKTKEELQKEKAIKLSKKDANSWKGVFIKIGVVLSMVLLLFFLLPTIIWYYYKFMAKRHGNTAQAAYWQYRGMSFYLHQLGYFRGANTPLQYAQKIIDPQFGSQFAAFILPYLKAKYAAAPIAPVELRQMEQLFSQNLHTIKAKLPLKIRLGAFLRPLRSVGFFNN